MTSELCRQTQCPYFGKFSGKAVCRYSKPKKYIKHLCDCPRRIEVPIYSKEGIPIGMISNKEYLTTKKINDYESKN